MIKLSPIIMYAIFITFCAGPTCPKGMTLLYGKCVGIARNTETDTGSKDNCKWKTNSNDLELAKFGNIKVSMDIFEKLYSLSVQITIYIYMILITHINFDKCNNDYFLLG